MRRDWTGPAQTKSRAERSRGSVLLHGAVRGDGWCAGDMLGYNLDV